MGEKIYVKVTMSRVDKKDFIPHEPKFDKFAFDAEGIIPCEPKLDKINFDISIAIEATRILSDFYRNISNMEKKKHVTKTLLNLSDALQENAELEVHILPFKITEMIAIALFRQVYKSIANNQKLTKGMFFLYKYFQNYIYGKEKTHYFADGANIFRAYRNTSLINPTINADKIIRALGDTAGQLIYDFIFTEDLKTMQEIFDKLRAICTPGDNRIFNTLKVHLTNYCLFHLYYHSVTGGGDVPAPLKKKSLILNELFEASCDYDGFLDATEEILYTDDYDVQQSGEKEI